MPDYQELYLTMMRATEKAVRILIEAQQDCEAKYVECEETPLRILPTRQNQQDEE